MINKRDQPVKPACSRGLALKRCVNERSGKSLSHKEFDGNVKRFSIVKVKIKKRTLIEGTPQY